MNAAPLFNKVALIGFGLIGGSIARAARAQGLAGEIGTTARSAKTRARVEELGIVDRVVATMRRRAATPTSSSSASRSAPADRWRRKSHPI